MAPTTGSNGRGGQWMKSKNANKREDMRGLGRWIAASPTPHWPAIAIPSSLPLRRHPRPDHGGAEEAGNTKGCVEAVGEGVSTLFPVWVGLGCVLGLYRPTSFNWVRPKWTIAGITVTLLGMGMTLTLDDLMPNELQYSNETVEAGSYGNIILKLLDLQRGDSLFQYGHPHRIKSMKVVDGLDALKILSPLVAQLVAAGGLVGWSDVCLTHLKFFILGCASSCTYWCSAEPILSKCGKVVSPLMPPISVATVAILCGNAIAQNASAILMSGQQVVLSVCLLRASGFFFGYILSRALGLYVSSSRTISIEVGMQVSDKFYSRQLNLVISSQIFFIVSKLYSFLSVLQNSVLGVVLAGQHFGNPGCSALCSFQRLPLYIWQFICWNLEIQHDNRE
ncbi:hypothetical protein Syun_009086 [Stephania yunnanensis]|uniref:Uncharacterized protein n=1 Tax=Stephania yunnanensis TaxID=152371 RepID=A0AAP0KE02_9MAGN